MKGLGLRKSIVVASCTVLALGMVFSAQGKMQHEYPNSLGFQVDQPLPDRPWVMDGDRRLDAESGVVRGWYRIYEPAISSVPEEAAMAFVKKHMDAFGGAKVVGNLRVTAVLESPAGYHVHLQQYHQGVKVYGGIINVAVNNDQMVTMVTSNPVVNINVTSVETSMTVTNAIENVTGYINAEANYAPDAELNVYRDASGDDHLAYVVHYGTSVPRGDWEVILGTDGNVVATTDRIMYDNGEGKAFQPDPLSTAETTYTATGYGDNNDADSNNLNAERVTIVLQGIQQVSGTYRLQGPYVTVVDWDPPTQAPATSTTLDGFDFTRSQQGFEDVNVYYHVDRQQRLIQSWGFTNLQNDGISVDPHGANGDDNSYFQPGANRLAFGEGGVDDAEDADVILHEYGHAVHFASQNFATFNDEMRAISEGNSDYWAGTNSARWSDYHSDWVFNWDGHNNYWPGRYMTDSGTYPGQWNGSIYDRGSIWTNGLWRFHNYANNPDNADAIVIQGLYYQSPQGNVVDAAEGILQAATELFEGQYYSNALQAMIEKGFVDPRANVSGQVTNSTDDSAVEGAVVTMEGPVTLEATTDEDGNYSIVGAALGDYTITARKTGYAEGSAELSVTEAEDLVQNLTVSPAGITVVPESMSFVFDQEYALDTALTITNTGVEMGFAVVAEPADAEPFEAYSRLTAIPAQSLASDSKLNGAAIHKGKIYVTGGNNTSNPNKMYVFNANGDLLRTFDQPSTSSSGFSDIASDGEYLWGSDGEKIYAFDESGALQDSITGVFSRHRAIAYDVDHDWFWVADMTSDIVALDREGTEHARFGNGGGFVYGLGYYPGAADIYKLAIYKEANGVNASVITIDPATGDFGPVYPLMAGTSNGELKGGDVGAMLEGQENYWLTAVVVEYNGVRLLEIYKNSWNVPYLNVEVSGGTLPVDGTQRIPMHFDLTVLGEAGQYESVVKVILSAAQVTVEVPVTVDLRTVGAEENAIPNEFNLSAAYPNPFNPSTTVSLSLPQTMDVRMAIYDVLGRVVEQQHFNGLNAGTHRLNWVAGGNVSSGVYFLKVDAGAHSAVQKLILMK